MFRSENIPVNFNGQVVLNDENYFFNVYNDELRIFYNRTGVRTAREFRSAYRTVLEKGLICGECPDKKRVVFLLGGENYSSYPDKYSEFRLNGCIKEIYYPLDAASVLLPDKKSDAFSFYDTINISGNLINNICPQKLIHFNSNGEMEIESFSVFGEARCFHPVTVELLPQMPCEFSVNAKYNQDVINGVALDTRIGFSFDRPRTIDEFPTIFSAVKRFVDFMAKARNTDFTTTLAQQKDGKCVEFAEVKIFNKYNNVCNKSFREVLHLSSVKDNIPTLFANLSDKKYPLLFLPTDNNDYGKVRYIDIQNLNTAIEMASQLDEKYAELKPKPKHRAIPKKKAEIIFEWCKKYVDIVGKTQLQYKGSGEPYYYELTASKIQAFRKMRNNITHRASGQVDMDIVNCFVALRSIFYYYVLGLDVQTEIHYGI